VTAFDREVLGWAAFAVVAFLGVLWALGLIRRRRRKP